MLFKCSFDFLRYGLKVESVAGPLSPRIYIFTYRVSTYFFSCKPGAALLLRGALVDLTEKLEDVERVITDTFDVVEDINVEHLGFDVGLIAHTAHGFLAKLFT